jgi:hypothetical protein
MSTGHLENFTSLPPHEERTFVVYEEYMATNRKKATTLGLIVGGIVGLIVVLIVLSVTPDTKEKISAEDMQGLTRAKKKAPAPTSPATGESPTAPASP